MRRACRSSFPPESMQTTKYARDMRLVDEPLDFDARPPDAVRLVPVKFRLADLTAREPDERETLELAPTTFAISFT